MLGKLIGVFLTIALVSAKAAEIHYHYHFDEAPNTDADVRLYSQPADVQTQVAVDGAVEDGDYSNGYDSVCRSRVIRASKKCLRRANRIADPLNRSASVTDCHETFAHDQTKCLVSHLGSDKHESWCSFKSSTDLSFCNAKAYLNRDANVRANAFNKCQADNNARLNSCGLVAAQKHLTSPYIATEVDKHLSWCTFNAATKRSYCRTSAYFSFSHISRNNSLNACETQYTNAVNACNAAHPGATVHAQRMLIQADKHNSWCTFQADSSNALCQTKALATIDPTQRTNALNACSAEYQLNTNKCSVTQLMKSMRRNLADDQHLSWCTFKTSNTQFWCKARSSLKWKKEEREAGLSACNDIYTSGLKNCADNASASKTTYTSQTQVNAKVNAN